MVGVHDTYSNYFVCSTTTHFLVSDWTLQGRFSCICVLLTLKAYPCTFSLKGQRSNGATPQSLLETEILPTANKLILVYKSPPVVSLYGHAPANNFYIISVPLDYMNYETETLSDDNWCIGSVWTTNNTY